MKKNLIKTGIRCFITFFSILYANNNYAQQLSINYKGTNISIPRFNEDSTLPFINWYTKNNIIYPIKQSTADWEIRMMKVYPHKSNGSIYQIVGIKDSIYFNKITFSESYAKDSVFRPDKLVNIEGGSWGLFRQIITVV